MRKRIRNAPAHLNCQNIANLNLGIDNPLQLCYTIDTVKKGDNIMEMTRMQKVWKELNYVVLIALIAGQCVVKADFLIGQFVYLFANVMSFTRCFVLDRPIADKIKDGCCLGITTGLIAMVILESYGIHIV